MNQISNLPDKANTILISIGYQIQQSPQYFSTAFIINIAINVNVCLIQSLNLCIHSIINICP